MTADAKGLNLRPMRTARQSAGADKGQVLVLFVLALVLVLIPAAGLGIDGSRAYEERRAAQIAADQAAIAATKAACVPPAADPVAKGLAIAAANGYNNSGIGTESGNTVTVVSTGTYQYTATVRSRIPGTFARLISGGGFNRFDVEAKATARGSRCGATGAGGPAPGPIWAGGASCPGGSHLNIEISGNLHQVTGPTHTNGSFYNGGESSNFNNYPSPAVTYAGSFVGGSSTNIYTAPQQQVPPPSPGWPTGWAPSDMPTSPTDPFWTAYRDRSVNTDKSASKFNVTSSGIWYTDNPSGVDVEGITAGVSMVIVASRGPIRLPTDLSTSNLVGRNFTPYNDPNLPKQNVILMTGFAPSDGKPCDSFGIEKSGQSGTFNGIIWAPRSLVRWSGNSATLNGSVIAHAFQMNGNEHRLNHDPSLFPAGGSPEISLLQ